VTNDIVRRVYEHKHKTMQGFSARYSVNRLVWYEAHSDVTEAIRREKTIKKWRRDWKIALIEGENPDWHDLYDQIAV
jgi:putative endonuclease